MSAVGDEDQQEQAASVTEAFSQIADIYVEASREPTGTDPELSLDVPEPQHRKSSKASSSRSETYATSSFPP